MAGKSRKIHHLLYDFPIFPAPLSGFRKPATGGNSPFPFPIGGHRENRGRAGLHPLYSQQSMLTFEGDQFQGLAAPAAAGELGEFFVQLRTYDVYITLWLWPT